MTDESGLLALRAARTPPEGRALHRLLLTLGLGGDLLELHRLQHRQGLAGRTRLGIAEGAADCGLRFYGSYGGDESPLSIAVREAGLVFSGRISRPRFWDSLSPMNYPFASRRIWAAKSRRELPTVDYAGSVLDPSVVQRLSAAELKPRYNPGPLKPFRLVLVPAPPKPEKKTKANAKASAREPAKADEAGK
jgi:hypothetical protein